jgi:hypothetical protein
MTFPLLDAELTPLLSLGLGGPILGIARWANRPRLAAFAACSLGCWGAAAWAAGQPPQGWLAPAGLAAAYVLTVTAIHFHDRIGRAVVHTRAVPAAFLALGPLFACIWALGFDHATQVEEFPFQDPPAAQVDSLPVLTDNSASTDRDRVIPLYLHESADESNLIRVEKRNAALYALSLIRTEAMEPHHNCHGWIFTGGRYWIRNEYVDSILADNGYQMVEKPRAGDLIIYRGDGGNMLHSGLVRVVDDRLVLIESKWGIMGRYVHPPAEQPYALTWTYYRSSRQGHLLNINDSSPGLATPISE